MSDLTEDEIRRERLVHIDQMLADIHRTYADRDRKRQEIRYAPPWILVLIVVVGSLTAGAALFAAGAAFVKLFLMPS